MFMPPVLDSLIGCTIAVKAEMPQAIVLANSFLKFHPQSEFAILLIEGPKSAATLPRGARLLYLDGLGLPKGAEWRWPMLHGAPEMKSLLKPRLLQTLLASGATIAAHFETSTDIFSSLPELLEMVEAADTIIATEAVRNEAGDLGRSFVAARRGAEKTLQSWLDLMRSEQPSAKPSTADDSPSALEGAFNSIPHRVITSPGFAVGFWNLNPDTFAWTGEHYEVEGNPLRSFDFRGYDPAKPHLLSKHQGVEPRLLLSERPAIAKICADYREKVIQAGYDPSNRPAYPFRYLPSGLRIDHRMLRLYQQAYRNYKSGLEKEPPSPFGPGGEEAFLNWLNEPMGKTPKVVTRYMLAVYRGREDVRKAFPDPIGVDAGGFRDWYFLFGQREFDLPAAVVPSDPQIKSQADRDAVTPINLAGYFRAELGIGAAARSLVAAFEAAQIPFNTISFDGTANRQTYPFVDHLSDSGPADINIVCVNADQIAAFAEKIGPELWHGRYTIGVWFWEVEDFPAWAHGAFNYVDEVWVASEFMHETFRKVSPKAVFKFKLPVLEPEIDPSLSRADLGLPDRFVFLFSFDFFSVLERKNPLGLIEAFTQAFRPVEGPVLVIKTINGEKRIPEMEKLRYAARGRPDIILKDGYLSAIENNSLTALADCYVSLHRSEGFGLTIAEAMALGKPAIATAYSGNLEFMTEENSYLCPAHGSEVGPEREPYPVSSHWSEPNLETAARLLRHVYTNQDEARERGLRAADHLRRLHDLAGSGSIIRDRLMKIRRRRAVTRPACSIAALEDRLEELEAENARLRGGL